LRFNKIGEITFHTGFLANHRFIGIYDDQSSRSQLFYFGDPTTHKIIKFFSMSGIYEFTIPLKAAIDSLGDISHFQVVSPDTVVVFGQHNNQIVMVNKKGDVWKSLDLNKIVEPYNNFKLSYVTTYSGSCIDHNEMYLHLEYLSKTDTTATLTPKYYFAEALYVPYFLKLSDPYDQKKISIQFGLDNFYKRFMTDSVAMSELVRYSVLNNKIAVFSIFSDSLYLITKDSLHISNIIKIESDYTKIGAQPIDLYSDEDYADYLQNIVRFKGYIAKVIYDRDHSLFLIAISCENKKRVPLARDFSYCFYNDDGSKIDEIFFSKEDFDPGLLYSCRGKYYVALKSNPNMGNTEQKSNKFGIYEILY
jgi:hypothetical protein